MLAAGLRGHAEPSKAAAAVICQTLQIQDRLTPGGQGMEQIGLAGAGATRQQPQGPGPLKLGQGPAAIALVATLQQQRGQFQHPRQPGDAAGAHAAAPAMQPQLSFVIPAPQLGA